MSDKPFYGSGSMKGFCVEARLQGSKPQNVAGMLLDNRWQRVSFPESPIGVPMPRWSGPVLTSAGLHTYNAAQALRWWFHAEAELRLEGLFGLETRIVPYRVKHSVEWEPQDEPIDYVGTWKESAAAKPATPAQPEEGK